MQSQTPPAQRGVSDFRRGSMNFVMVIKLIKNLAPLLILTQSWNQAAWAFPDICTVVKTPTFENILDLQHSSSVCGGPVPRPCARFSYRWPQFFIEVTNQPGESFFSSIPGVAMQLAKAIASGLASLPFGTEDDEGAYSFHAHTINVPFSKMGSLGMPCGGGLRDHWCLSSMSEHIGRHWKTGEGDAFQPAWRAWSLSPKACLIKGAAESTTGNSTPTGHSHTGLCSSDRSWMPRFPPSNQPVCTGWGIHFPRYGTVTSSSQTTASLVIADRLRTLGSELFQTVPTDSSDRWQMIYPTASDGFRRGQNIAILRAKGVSEMGRLASGKMKDYLYVVWKRVRCTKDLPYIASTKIWHTALKTTCNTKQ